MRFIFISFFLFLNAWMFAQDAYHQSLDAQLMSEYNLPPATWLIADSEAAILSSVGSYGCSQNIVPVVGEDFSSASEVIIASAGSDPWSSGWSLSNTSNVQVGDKVLVVLWVRSTGQGAGKANIFVEHATTFVKEVLITSNILSEWTPYYIPFEAGGNYAVGQMAFGFHLGFQAQTLEIGGYTAINYGSSVDLEDLPSNLNNEQYGGFEEDAAWRVPAEDRIEQLRKATLTINAQKTDGTPVNNALVDISMERHEFAFGSAITAERIAGNPNQNLTYESKITDLDGNGHGFNWVVFENDMKWDAWEEQWFVNNAQLVNAVNFLDGNSIKTRGHNLVWPSWQYLPDDIAANANDPTFIWNRIEGRLTNILNYPGLEVDRIPEWDVLNEIVTNTSLETPFSTVPGNVTGREVYADIFDKAKEISPQTKMYINDYVTMTLGNTGGGQYDVLKQRIQELLDAGAPVEGIGFQAHIGGFPNGIPSILGTLDDFYNSFGLTAKITEFDLPTIVSEELAANYLRDFLTATFSHASVDGFLFWSFWDDATWQNPGANLFRSDWSRTPAGDMFVDLVFNQWWTDVSVLTSTNGLFDQSCFKGAYEITYVCNGETITETVEILDDQTFTIVCDNLAVGIQEIDKEEFGYLVSPNPANEFLTITRKEGGIAMLTLFDSLGRTVLETDMQGTKEILDVSNLSGIFFLEIQEGNNRMNQKIVIK